MYKRNIVPKSPYTVTRCAEHESASVVRCLAGRTNERAFERDRRTADECNERNEHRERKRERELLS